MNLYDIFFKIFFMILLFDYSSYHIDKVFSSYLQLSTVLIFLGICMSIGILCFPAGWDNDHVRGICGASAADYVLGDCGIR